MGYHLWTSPITGYRRKGTRLSELRSVLTAKIGALAILEPLQCCPASAQATEMRGLLGERGFDVAGVMNDAAGRVIGFVAANELSDGIVLDHTKSLKAEHLVSDATPIADLLKVLREKERAFVLVGPEVKGIVTLADLNKPPIRVYLFGLVSLLEMHVRFWIKTAYPNGSWKKCLSDKRLEYANRIQTERQKRNQQIDLLDCVQFCDLRDLLLGSEEVLNKLCLKDKKMTQELLREAEKLRDKLAHSQENLVEGTSWQALIDLIDSMESLVHQSDDTVEHEAKLSKKDGPSLWPVG